MYVDFIHDVLNYFNNKVKYNRFTFELSNIGSTIIDLEYNVIVCEHSIHGGDITLVDIISNYLIEVRNNKINKILND